LFKLINPLISGWALVDRTSFIVDGGVETASKTLPIARLVGIVGRCSKDSVEAFI
jgi:hypothetical protein